MAEKSNMDEKLDAQLQAVTEYFNPRSRIVILTGAGISAESGIPTFRGKGGLWEKYDPSEVATAEALRLRPKKVWEMHEALRQNILSCKPNPAHTAIAKLETLFKTVTIITQNVDNYHQDAGCKNVLELHGNAWRVRCTAEDKAWVDKTVPYEELPPKCECGATLRPDVVFFDEPLNNKVLEAAFEAANQADIMIVIGTSYVVIPAAYLPALAKQAGALIIDVNIESSPLTTFPDTSLIGEAGEIMPKLVEKLQLNIK